jgi:hypothetical protein
VSRVLLVALLLVAVALPASAGPDCTCDPNVVTDTIHCLQNGTRCHNVDPVEIPWGTIRELLHPDCACDPLLAP